MRRFAVPVMLALAGALAATPASAQTPAAQGIGVVTTLAGPATVARAAAAPAPLRFRDALFARDRVATGEGGFLRVLLGGKALVTVRELSVVTITEDLARTTMDIESGKLSLGVVPTRVRPGESFEIRSGNAVAAVRGSVVIAEIVRPQGPTGPIRTDLYVLRGLLEVILRTGGTPVQVTAMQALSVLGNTLGQIRQLTPDEAGRITGDLRPRPQHTGAPDAARQTAGAQGQSQIQTDIEVLGGGSGGVGKDTQVDPPTSIPRQVPLLPPRQAPLCRGPYC
jgi:hypothetical protein